MKIPINFEIIQDTHFIKMNGKFYIIYEVNEDAFNNWKESLDVRNKGINTAGE